MTSGRRPSLLLLATGGTIAGAQTGADSISYRAGVLSAEALVSAVPSLHSLADLHVRQVLRLGSQDMDEAAWLQLHAAATAAVQDPSCDGIVITHGTDTLEETAYFLHLTLATHKPVVIVGAMRPATAISADGPMNLYNAVAVAADSAAAGQGVLVVANDEIHSAREVTKTNTTQVGTFRSSARGLVGTVTFGRIHWFSPPLRRHTLSSALLLPASPVFPRVDIHYAHAGARADLIEASVRLGASGLVLAGVGAGNLNRATRTAVSAATASGCVVVRSTRTGSGLVERNTEMEDEALGTVVAEDLNPSKARVLLLLGLLQTRDPARLQELYRSH